MQSYSQQEGWLNSGPPTLSPNIVKLIVSMSFGHPHSLSPFRRQDEKKSSQTFICQKLLNGWSLGVSSASEAASSIALQIDRLRQSKGEQRNNNIKWQFSQTLQLELRSTLKVFPSIFSRDGPLMRCSSVFFASKKRNPKLALSFQWD